jgi:Fe-S cluster assembly protein SufD
MTAARDHRTLYAALFSRLESGGARLSRVDELRRPALERFLDAGFPTTDEEAWRFTNLAPIAKTAFELPSPPQSWPSADDVRRISMIPQDSPCLVFVNGWLAPGLSSAASDRGIRLAPMSEAMVHCPERTEPHLARLASYQDRPLVALNIALWRDGAFLEVSRGADPDVPICLVHLGVGNGAPLIINPRNLLVVNDECHAIVVESYVGLGGTYFTNSVTDCVVGARATVDHYSFKCEGDSAFHIGTLEVRQERGSVFRTTAITTGGAVVRNEANVQFDAERCEGTLDGLYLARGRQLVDNHTRLEHARPHCTSHELYKGILDGQAHAVFTGRIHVHPDAQKTDAKQTNQALLLSPDAVINTQPQLEIYADDVRCTHGATVGQLDQDALFYLRSRSLSAEHARCLLVFAFANEIVGRVKVPTLRAGLERMLLLSGQFPGIEAAEVR